MVGCEKVKSISSNHQAIVNAIISGMTYDAACLAVYPQRSGWTKKAREISVSKILNLPHVREYYEEQRQILDMEKAQTARNDALWSLKESADTLRFVIKLAQKDAIEISKRNQESEKYNCAMSASTAGAITKAVTVLNQMFDIAAPSAKTDNTSPINFIDDLEDEAVE